mmetsp:Transcript_2515/g.3691  ORF Transcript_2515/g.3691 Transcript_2515/m.3691 type:complete len:201 (-) Transcript_2515:649-1251(-)
MVFILLLEGHLDMNNRLAIGASSLHHLPLVLKLHLVPLLEIAVPGLLQVAAEVLRIHVPGRVAGGSKINRHLAAPVPATGVHCSEGQQDVGHGCPRAAPLWGTQQHQVRAAHLLGKSWVPLKGPPGLCPCGAAAASTSRPHTQGQHALLQAAAAAAGPAPLHLTASHCRLFACFLLREWGGRGGRYSQCTSTSTPNGSCV